MNAFSAAPRAAAVWVLTLRYFSTLIEIDWTIQYLATGWDYFFNRKGVHSITE
jgi:hypothetical protein